MIRERKRGRHRLGRIGGADDRVSKTIERFIHGFVHTRCRLLNEAQIFKKFDSEERQPHADDRSGNRLAEHSRSIGSALEPVNLSEFTLRPLVHKEADVS